MRLAEVYAYRGEFDESFKWLQTAAAQTRREMQYSPDRNWLVELRFSPFLRRLHADPRWDEWAADALDREKPHGMTRGRLQVL